MIPQPFKHQIISVQKHLSLPRSFNTSDAGTGKTRSVIDTLTQRLSATNKCALILAPKSILQASWGQDLLTFAPHMTWVISTSPNHPKQMAKDAKIYITNHDAVNWLAKQPKAFFEKFSDLVVDESTAYKHRTSLRSKALRKISNYFENIILMTATPTTTGVLDLWHQMLILDRGERLGSNYWHFRNATHDATPDPAFPSRLIWTEKPGISEVVASLTQDITIRFARDECLDLPERIIREIRYTLPTELYETYQILKKKCIITLNEETTVFQKHTLRTKLLQAISGVVYDKDKEVLTLDNSRTNLVLDLAEEVPHAIVAFNWHHQVDQLTKLATHRHLNFAILDGNTHNKADVIERFQNGEYRILFAHPQSASHGLTLTKATRTIWASPCQSPELFSQMNDRIYRAGQTKKTEILLIAAEDTLEPGVYLTHLKRLSNMNNLLEMMEYKGPPINNLLAP